MKGIFFDFKLFGCTRWYIRQSTSPLKFADHSTTVKIVPFVLSIHIVHMNATEHTVNVFNSAFSLFSLALR